METTLCQELKVVEVFRFPGERTVFVGTLEGNAKFVPACDADLIVDNRPLASLHLEGEMVPDKAHPLGYRSVSTTDTVDVGALSPGRQNVRLRIHLARKDG